MLHTLWGPGDWFNGIIESVVNFFVDGAKFFLEEVLHLLFVISMPKPSVLWNHWFMSGLGGVLGVALLIWKLLVIVIGFVVLVGITRRLNEKRRMQISRLGSSMALLSLFSLAFFPIYGLVYSFDQDLVKAMITFITGKPGGDINAVINSLLDTIIPGNAVAKLIAAGITMCYSILILVEAGILFLVTIATLIFYPLTIALRPLGKIGNDVFNAANSAIGVTLLSPPIMAGGLLLPVAVSHIKGFGAIGILQVFAALAGGIIAAATPVMLAVLFYRKSSEMFGFVDANVAGRLDINSIPPVTTRAMEESLEETHSSAIGDFAKSVAGGAVATAVASESAEELFANMKNVVTDAAGTAATVSGHPWVGALINLSNDKKPGESDST